MIIFGFIWTWWIYLIDLRVILFHRGNDDNFSWILGYQLCGANCFLCPLNPLTQFPKGCSCGSVSKPCTPGEHQNSWVKMDVHPTKNGINRYWSIPMSFQSPLIPFKLWNTSQVVILYLCTVLDPPSSARWWLSFFAEAGGHDGRMIGIAPGKEKGEEEQRTPEDSQKTRKQSPLAECNWFWGRLQCKHRNFPRECCRECFESTIKEEFTKPDPLWKKTPLNKRRN